MLDYIFFPERGFATSPNLMNVGRTVFACLGGLVISVRQQLRAVRHKMAHSVPSSLASTVYKTQRAFFWVQSAILGMHSIQKRPMVVGADIKGRDR